MVFKKIQRCCGSESRSKKILHFQQAQDLEYMQNNNSGYISGISKKAIEK